MSPQITNFIYASAAAVVPGLLILYYIVKRDKFPEPPRVVITTLFLGFGIILPINFFIPIIEGFGAGMHKTVIAEDFYQAFIRASFLEETMKFLIIIYYCLHLDEFDEPIDALIYGVAASLGFAIYENWQYVINALNSSGYAEANFVAIVRTFSALLLHTLAGIMMGFFVMDAVFHPKNRKINLTLAIAFPVYFHGFYDFILFSKSISDWWIYILIIIFLIRVYFIFKEQIRSQNEIKNKDKKYLKVLPHNSDVIFSILATLVSISIIYYLINFKI